jgi:hypothetical protein
MAETGPSPTRHVYRAETGERATLVVPPGYSAPIRVWVPKLTVPESTVFTLEEDEHGRH